MESLPSRERGLKPRYVKLCALPTSSLPSRERGLKHDVDAGLLEKRGVAPLAGAWIETFSSNASNRPKMSLPSRERGLKPEPKEAEEATAQSLPSRERGLKPPCSRLFLAYRQSLPSRERGLKPNPQKRHNCRV